MKTLIGDIGNTDIKLCIVNENFKILKKINFNTLNVKKDINFKNKINFLIKKRKINNLAFFSSVVPFSYNRIKKILKKIFNINCVELKQMNYNKIIKIKVNKRQIGSDRIANAVGSLHHYKSNCIVIDFGTATTFDVIINGVYYGGVIAPGIKLSLKNLTEKAKLIPVFNIKKIKKIIGNNTISALRSGFYFGYIGLINNILELIKKDTKKNFKVILTGGFSYLFKNSLKFKTIIDKDITLKGLIKIIELKNKSN